MTHISRVSCSSVGFNMIIKYKQHHQLPNKEGRKEMTYANVFGLEVWKWAAVRRAHAHMAYLSKF